MALVIGKGIGPPAACKRKNDERGNSGRYRAVIGCGEEISGTAMYSSFMSERDCHMRIRPYIESRDFASLETWIEDEKIHALWCADLIPYPVTKENFHAFLEKKCPGMDRQRICGNRKKRRTDRLFLLLCQRG